MLKINDLHVRFGKKTVLNGLNLQLNKGEILAMVGPNGAGKTTLLRILSGLLNSDSGRVHFSESLKHGDVSYVFDKSGMMDQMSVGANLAFYAELLGLDDTQLRSRFQEFLRIYQMADPSKKKFKALSAGQKQLVTLFRGSFFDPSLLILDEPSSHLDPTNQMKVTSFIKRLRRENGTTVFLTSHNLLDVSNCADRIVFIYEGKIHYEISRDHLDQLVLFIFDENTPEAEMLFSHSFEIEKSVAGKKLCLLMKNALPDELASQKSYKLDLQSLYALMYMTSEEEFCFFRELIE